MSIEYGPSTALPWIDGWPHYYQLWQFSDSREPGEELDLTAADDGGGNDRTLTARFKTGSTVIFSTSEDDDSPMIAIAHGKRGVVAVTLESPAWEELAEGITYTLEIIAYGVLYYSGAFTISYPAQTEVLLNGVDVYGSPRQILELLGPIPGASVEVSRSLSIGYTWTTDDRGYQTTSVTENLQIYGLWVGDRYAKEVSYAELATGPDRAWARSGNTLYYKGPEDLTSEFVETAYSIYVWRCLKEASAEADRRTGRRFGLWRYIREPHRGLRGMRQIIPRHLPYNPDGLFRLDTFSASRRLFRRFTESDFFPSGANGSQMLHAEPDTGIITVNQNIWDFWDWGYAFTGDIGLANFATLPKGENNIELTYTGGYDVTPPDVDEAVANLAAIRQAIYWQQAMTQGMSGLSIGCVNLNFGQLFSQYTPAWQGSAYQILDSYTSPLIEAL